MAESNESEHPIPENTLGSGLGRINKEFMLRIQDKQLPVLAEDLGQSSGVLVEPSRQARIPASWSTGGSLRIWRLITLHGPWPPLTFLPAFLSLAFLSLVIFSKRKICMK